ncbi:methyltransferase domain-containing protein [Actinobacillus equuli subsp. haemolyticus]|uniref:class I SAM-dependent methyltransferase n=1 Tax=Actinobacillus equuli TaxID=718 RepID=UPI0024412D6F|nr:class I SAM-dependent methyltransferase [Actinobacillus equuli]WGE49256.1 methyltransferase domain-containing protein [Actinobacillus equuli subsp. equuli]WGE59925.1 methyltransferase domain-containing protein [Actinobacillus equuli subsp. haemolyticus]WGE61428.1 methyltransferase domain-containing protein [Actinobacillus equuli subsp. haemolyticus]WGE65972.1 methyltransferase domain-containing protein [Actinobacillus equuli subsp. equuli]WGE68376.1 methyltransferase domain-containing prote
MKKEEVGHNFLARLGKTRLRPGGKLATDWLIANGDFNKDKKVLEVACNMCTTAIQIATQYGCHITGIDLDEEALDKARVNIKEHEVENLVQVQRANATKLPFEDNSFDIVINEAMLTMLPIEAKEKAIREYIRVLKPGGFLLTHDVMLNTEDAETVIQSLREAINLTVTPLTKEGWKNLFHECGFRNVDAYSGEMTLLSPKGLIHDEGVLGAMKIVGNALKPENRDTFKKMFQTFNDPENKLGFIAVCSQK